MERLVVKVAKVGTFFKVQAHLTIWIRAESNGLRQGFIGSKQKPSI
jgi:hypothetical protein